MADPSESGASTSGILAHTARIVSAHVGHNTVAAADLPRLIRDVHAALSGLLARQPDAPAPVAARRERQKPAVAITRSVFDTHIVCLEDGKKLKMLRGHLKRAYGMSPEQYRAKWELGPDYPMVAPEYARKRSSLAKAIGLGTRHLERAD